MFVLVSCGQNNLSENGATDWGQNIEQQDNSSGAESVESGVSQDQAIEQEATMTGVSMNQEVMPVTTSEDMNLYLETSQTGLKDFDCKWNEFSEICYARKLSDTWLYRYSSDLSCEEMLNVNDFPIESMKDKVENLLAECKKEEQYKIEEQNRRAAVEKFQFSDCDNVRNLEKYKGFENERVWDSYLDEVEWSCKLWFALNSPQRCDLFTDQEEKNRCVKLQDELNQFMEIRWMYEFISNYDASHYME